MRPDGVVVFAPALDQLLSFPAMSRRSRRCVSELRVQALTVAILPWTSRLDVKLPPRPISRPAAISGTAADLPLNAKTNLDEIARIGPRILEAARAALANATKDLGFLRLDKTGSPNISVD